MAVADKAREMLGLDPEPFKVPKRIDDRITRARKRTKEGASQRNLCFKFWRGEQNWYVDEKNVLRYLDTVTHVGNTGGKPQHRVRNYPNLITTFVKGKVSAATQRVPGYEVNPTSFDPTRIAAASLASRVAVYGYDQWNVRRATKKWVELALVADEGFVWPFWDSNIGPFVQDPDGGYVGMGDVRLRVLSRNEVGWEPGVDFDESPWLYVEQARPVHDVLNIDGYLGGKLEADAKTGDIQTEKTRAGENLVRVTEYLERPCPEYPLGRWLTIANNRVIAGIDPEAGIPRPYPLTDHEGKPVDEPCLIRLSYTVDPDADQDMGLVRHLIDPQRALSDAWSKALEWKNRCLNPQMNAPIGAFPANFRKDDTPGAINYYRPVGGQKPEWENVPPVPDSLFKIMDQSQSYMQTIAHAQDIPQGVEAGRAIAAFIEQQQVQWQEFLGDLAEGHSRVMRHCLYLVQRYYKEPRLLQIRGRIGWEPLEDFQGVQLLGQSDVRVLPGSIETLTRQAIQDRLTFLVTNFPGAISAEQAQAALEGGTGEQLIKSYEVAMGRANRIVQLLKAGIEETPQGPQAAIFNVPPRPVFPGEEPPPVTGPDGQPIPVTDPTTGQPQIDPATGQPVVQRQNEMPGWMPRPFDNIPVLKAAMEDWMQTDEFESQQAPIQEAAGIYYAALLDLEAKQAQRAAEMQQAAAQQQGSFNAAKPQGPAPMPSLPGQQQPPQGGTPPSPSP